MVKTYNSKEVYITLGRHLVTGTGEDSFVTITQNSDGITSSSGCDGEVVRSISPDNTHTINITLLQTSPTNGYLQRMADKDRNDGSGMFPVLIKDMRGGLIFSASDAWVMKQADRQFGREATSRSWAIGTGDGKLEE